MQLLGKLEIKSKEKVIEFLSSQQTGRIASIDDNGFPQINEIKRLALKLIKV